MWQNKILDFEKPHLNKEIEQIVSDLKKTKNIAKLHGAIAESGERNAYEQSLLRERINLLKKSVRLIFRGAGG
jgi:protein-arginine kinase activator protein McsA